MKVVEMMKVYRKGNKLVERARDIANRMCVVGIETDWKCVVELAKDAVKVFSALDSLSVDVGMNQDALVSALAGDEDSFIRACITNENQNNEQEEN